MVEAKDETIASESTTTEDPKSDDTVNENSTEDPKPDDTINENTEDPKDETDDDKKEDLIENLYILPPKIPNTPSTRLHLPPLRMDEPISSIKAVLSEVLGYAHISNYRLILEKSEEIACKPNGNEHPLVEELVYGYTSKGIIAPPPTEKEIVLDDYTDLSTYKTHIDNNYKCIRVVLERYNLASVKDHVVRIKSLMDGNCPHLDKLIMEEKEEVVEKEEDKVAESSGDEQSVKKKKKKKSKKKKEDKEEDLTKKAAELLKELSNKLPNYPLDTPLTQNYTNLEYFYKYSCHTDEESKELQTYIEQMKELDSKTQVPLIVKINEKPKRFRNICFNDIAYLDVEFQHKTYHITAIPSGFYINRSNDKFDPRPREECCYSHSLLDCLLLASEEFQLAWSEAMKASKERASLNNKTSSSDTPLYALYRIIQRANDNASLLDSVILKPCWLLPGEVQEVKLENPELNTRCWNEEYQSGREMPKGTLQERIDRARVLHKVQVDFTDAAIQGVKHIVEGFLVPMNPSENYKSHVYLHNNIFFSRAVDAANQGVMETFKIAKGDKAARKSASRDVNCIHVLHKLDVEGLYTLLTVLVDYLGVRYVCQSVVPGILHGEKTHELLCGAVEANSPLLKNDEFHELLLEVIGKQCRVATRNVPIYPLEEKEGTIEICVPMEAKGIQGSDKRRYILDLTRVTPRDANWVVEGDGGTGNWEKITKSSLEDDEWTMAVLRPELINLLTHKKMAEFIKEAEKANDSSSPRSVTEQTEDSHLASLQYNVNVFLPSTQKSLQIALTPTDLSQYSKDEEQVRETSNYLFNEVLPTLTQEIRENSLSQNYTLNTLPVDGNSLKELLHSRGINMRYLGRLAQLAHMEEESDAALIKENKIKRKSMPQCWLELLEVEMVARATRHVLNYYFLEMEEGCGEVYPAQIISSVLSAIVSTKEESAADTEKRLGEEEEEDETFYAGNYYPNNYVSRDRSDIWKDIECEIGRRYRYTLHLFNRESGRVMYLPLLRRVCQICGIRLTSKNYNIGGKSFCSTFSSSVRNTTYPVAPRDVLDILPLIKHSGSGTGFTPSFSSSCIGTTLHVMLPDATSTQQVAQLHYKNKALSKALDAAQDAASLYQRVIDTALHVNIAHCLDLSAIILFAAQELDLAAGNAARSLALYVQLFGPDCMEVVTCHTTLAHILLTSSSSASSDAISFGIQHLRNALYLMQIMAGPNYIDISSLYHKLGTMYHEVGSGLQALRFYQEALTQHGTIYDKMLESMITKSIAMCCSALGQYKSAFEYEKRAYSIYSSLFGEKHELTVNSSNSLSQYMKLAVAQGSKLLAEQQVKDEKEVEKEVKEIEEELLSEEDASKKKKAKKKKNKKKN